MRDRPNDRHTKALAIKSGEVRDHINEDKTDNTPANLRAMPRGAALRAAMHGKEGRSASPRAQPRSASCASSSRPLARITHPKPPAMQ